MIQSKFNLTKHATLKRWTKLSTIGWLLGFVLVLAGSISVEAIGFDGFQLMVGVGMGAGVGIVQSRMVKMWDSSPQRWIVASTMGMGAPFLVTDVATILLDGLSQSFAVLAFDVIAGALLASILQQRLLPAQFKNVNWWIFATVIGWVIAGGFSASGPLYDSVFSGRWLLFVLNLGVLCSGGIILGLVTGFILERETLSQHNGLA